MPRRRRARRSGWRQVRRRRVEAQRAVLWRQRAGPAGTAQRSPFRRARAPPVASHAPPPPLRSSAILDGQAGGRAGVCVRCESRHECCQALRALTRCRSRVLACVRRACMRASCGRAGGRVCLRACCSCMRVSAWCEGARWIVTSAKDGRLFSLKKKSKDGVNSGKSQRGPGCADSGGFYLLVCMEFTRFSTPLDHRRWFSVTCVKNRGFHHMLNAES